MGFLSWLSGQPPRAATPDTDTAFTANSNPVGVPATVGPPSYGPGDPDGLELTGTVVEGRSLPAIYPSPWSGWPAEWNTPLWMNSSVRGLVDTAWACLDKNASILAAMPVYKTRGGRVADPETWMVNPDPRVYTSWQEFAKQVFWDYQGCGEVFILATDYFTTGYPMFMRVIPPWMVKVEMEGASRRYWVGSVEITADVLHIRYKSAIGCAHGEGPLDIGSLRVVASGVLARYISTMTSATPPYATLETDQDLSGGGAQAILDQYLEGRTANRGLPLVLDRGLKYNAQQFNARDMALLELAQYTDSRICVLLGVPPVLMALPSGGDSMTYTNVESLFEFHDRSYLRTAANAVMSAISGWALPRGQDVELDREDYTRPSLTDRVNAYTALANLPEPAITSDEIRALERTLYATSGPVGGSMTPLPLGGEQ